MKSAFFYFLMVFCYVCKFAKFSHLIIEFYTPLSNFTHIIYYITCNFAVEKQREVLH